MKPHKRVRLGVALATITAVVIASAFYPGVPAFADVTGPSVIKYRNASDPWITTCFGTESNNAGFWGLCMFTSSDMQNGNLPGNDYPMSQTFLYTLADGQHPGNPDNWVDRGAVLNESSYSWVARPRNGTNSNHLWAPFAAIGGNFEYFLYVPDVEDNSQAGMSTSSRIGVSKASNPWGPYSYQSQLRYNNADLETYMSDPSMIQIMGSEPAYDPPAGSGIGGSNPGNQAAVPEASRWMIWADGDFSNCGGISMARLDDRDMTSLITEPFQLQITGLSGNNCSGKNHPYLEGAEIYFARSMGLGLTGDPAYLMVFAWKPNNGNERIGWATSESVRGPYAYQGDLFASSSTAWTNQASIVRYGDKMIIVYHDAAGSSVPQNRKVHAECLTVSNGRFNTASRTNISGSNTLPCFGSL